MQEKIMRRSLCWHLAAWVCALFVLAVFAQPSRGNVIYVTTLEDKAGFGMQGGCSLKEAIFSSRFQRSVAINSYQEPDTPVNTELVPMLVLTECVAGSGDDIIVLPTGLRVFGFDKVTNDADNFAGPTATPIITTKITIQGNGAALVWESLTGYARAFAVAAGGQLTLQDVSISGFSAKGGTEPTEAEEDWELVARFM